MSTQGWSAVAGGYRADVLRTVFWLIRAGAYAVVGADVFARGSYGPVALQLMVGAYAFGGLMMAVWAALALRAGSGDPEGTAGRGSVWLPWVLGALTVTSGAVCAVPGAGSMVALAMMATVEAGSETPLAAGWTVAGAGVLAVETGALVAGAGGEAAVGYPLLLVIGLLMGHNRRAYRLRAEQSAAMVVQLERLRAEQRRADVLDERTRIAREIHDVLAHSLGALGIQIQAARALLTDHGDVDRAVGVLTVAQRIASDGLGETRRAVHALRTDSLPLDDELAAMAATHRQRHGTAVELTVEGSPVPLPSEQTLCLVRTAQESLTNAAKHAPRQPVTLRIRHEDDDVTLAVGNALDEDRASEGGPAFATVDGGYGLTGMRERLLLVGGTLTAGPADGGWVVTARVPR